jgi:hypothetical protein
VTAVFASRALNLRHCVLSCLCLSLSVAGCSDTTASVSGTTDSEDLGTSDVTVSFPDAKDIGSSDASVPDSGTDAVDFDSSNPGTCVDAGAPWCACKGNADCDSGLCLDTPAGHVCAAKCVDKCADGYACAGVNSGGGDMSTVCVPKWGWLCDPCSTNADCDSPGLGKQAACLDYGDVGHFCGFDCTDNSDCPGGYTCGEGKTIDGATRKQCWFGAGAGAAATVCGCSTRAAAMELATTCWATDGGSGAKCGGLRHCTPTGLEACSGKPGKETCNGKDDDCDGLTDNLACDDQNDCTQDLCDAAKSSCTNNMLDGSPCNADNTECTANDACQSGACKPGAAKTCSDGNPCTDDSCDPKAGCVFANNSAGCDDGKICTTNDYCAGGVCNAGKSNNCDDANSCTDQTCDPVTGNCNTTFNTLNCDDGSACSSGDKCKDGVCKAGVTVDCTDTDACTLDSCDISGGCKHSVSTGVCDDGDACSYGETCASGACGGGQNLNCDDKNACTADSCDKATGCKHTPQNGGCDDSNACTTNDACSGGTCLGAAIGPCASDLNPCTDEMCDPSVGCVSTNNALPCSDGSVCTQNDACAGGKCLAGATLNCNDDGNPCTTEQCNAVTGCESVNNSAACEDGDACTLNDVCNGGTCKPGAAKDCSGLTTTCGTGKCSLGACYMDPLPVETVCPTGLCDGAGTCVTPGTYTIDGCTGTNYVNCTEWYCYGCLIENGFSAYNTTSCEGTGCFDRFPSFGQNGYVIMEAQWADTAYVEWQFPQALIGNYKLEAWLPEAIPASANGGACAADSTTTYAAKAVYHLKTAGNELGTVTLNHQTLKGTTKPGTLVPLWSGDATGLTSIRLNNGSAPTTPPACQFYLVDAIVATPLPTP